MSLHPEGPAPRRSAIARGWWCGVAAVVPGALGAQAQVAGVVRDSLGHGPLAGAVVQLVPADRPTGEFRTAPADSAGRYALSGVAPGRYLVTFSHPRLDSLGLAAPGRAVEVPLGAPDVRADLASPGAGTVVAALCGARAPGDGGGVLFGRVLDAERGEGVAADAAAVTVRWGELVVDGAGLRRVVRRVRAVAAPDGRYAACGVPVGVPVAVYAAAGEGRADAGAGAPGMTSGEVEVTLAAAEPAVYRALLVGAAAPEGVRRGTAALAGRVLGPDGRPAAGARVVLRGSGAADTVARAAADGRYRFDALPSGTFRVDASAIGFAPASGAADLRPGRTASLDVALGRRVTTLDPVAVYAPAIRADHEFARRMRMGIGRFVTAAQLRRDSEYGLTNALAASPGLRLIGMGPNGAPIIRGRANCTPDVYLDGMLVQPVTPDPDGFTPLYQFVRPSQVEAIEVYTMAHEIPPAYRRNVNSCASVLVWTKRGLQ